MWIGYKSKPNPTLSDISRTFETQQHAIDWLMHNDAHDIHKIEIKEINFEFDHNDQFGYEECFFYKVAIEIKLFERHEKFIVTACVVDDEVDGEDWVVCNDSGEEIDKDNAEALLEILDLETLTLKHHHKRITQEYEFLHIDFGISISGIDVFIRKEITTGESNVVLMEGSNTHLAHERHFNSADEAMNWINKYRTGEIEDYEGLKKLMSKIHDDNCP